MLVSIQTLRCKFSFESKLFKMRKHAWLDWYLIFSNNKTLSFIHSWVSLSIPAMAFYLLDSETSIRVNLHNFRKNVLTIIAEAFGHLELPGEDFLVEFTCVFIFER